MNLIKNIGFDTEATHTRQIADELHMGKRQVLEFPLDHLNEIKRDSTHDMMYSKQFFKYDTRLSKDLKYIIKKVKQYV